MLDGIIPVCWPKLHFNGQFPAAQNQSRVDTYRSSPVVKPTTSFEVTSWNLSLTFLCLINVSEPAPETDPLLHGSVRERMSSFVEAFVS
jgi:hypothetical protein